MNAHIHLPNYKQGELGKVHKTISIDVLLFHLLPCFNPLILDILIDTVNGQWKLK